MRRCKVLIADDRAQSRDGLRSLLDTVPEVEVVGEAVDGQEAVRLVEEHHPDVILMDAQMPDVDGLEATRIIKGRWPQVKVVVLTMYGSYRTDALAAGAGAFLLKGCSDQDLLAAILDDTEVEGTE
jgi:DNA-binding NarL/FixJ family response regulator